MIDQTSVATGLPVAPRGAAARDQAGAYGQDDENGRAFRDLVDGAQDPGGREAVDESANASDADETKAVPAADKARDGTTTAADRVSAATPASRIKVAAGIFAMSKSTDASANASQKNTKGLGQHEIGTQKATDKTGVRNKVAEKTSVDGADAANPADELRAILGIAGETDEVTETSGETEKPATKKSAKGAQQVEEDTDEGDQALVQGTTNTVDQQKTRDFSAIMTSASAGKADTAEQFDNDDAASPGRRETRVTVVGKSGQSMSIGQTDEKRASLKTDGTQKTDFVTVLESRRYLGFSTQSNAGALVQSVAGDPALTNALSMANLGMGSEATITEVNTLKLQLNPENLGSMTASLRLKGDELSVEVRVETHEAYKHLSEDRDGIVKALQDQGFNIDQVTIQLSPSADTSGDQDPNQSAPNQNMREGQGNQTRDGGDGSRRPGNQATRFENGQVGGQGNSAPQSGTSGSGSLYL